MSLAPSTPMWRKHVIWTVTLVGCAPTLDAFTSFRVLRTEEQVTLELYSEKHDVCPTLPEGTHARMNGIEMNVVDKGMGPNVLFGCGQSKPTFGQAFSPLPLGSDVNFVVELSD